ncbi:hypothetical protein ES703_65349 [subsurface metagenome]
MDELKIAAAIIYSKMIENVSPNDDMGKVAKHYWNIVEALYENMPKKLKNQSS